MMREAKPKERDKYSIKVVRAACSPPMQVVVTVVVVCRCWVGCYELIAKHVVRQWVEKKSGMKFVGCPRIA